MSLGPINRRPVGLLSMLDLQTFGQVPLVLSDVLMPTFDVLEHYQQQARQSWIMGTPSPALAGLVPGQTVQYTDAIAITATPGTAITVPSNQAWYVLHWEVGFNMSAAAGGSGKLAAAYQTIAQSTFAGGTFATYTPPQQFDGQNASNAGFATNGYSRVLDPFWLGPGDRLCGLVIESLVAGGTVLTTFSRLRVIPLIA